MCVIAICKTRHLTSLEIEVMNAANPHGIGVAWARKKRGVVEWAKNLSVAQATRLLPTLRLPYIVHFRLASVGGISPELCHPFPMQKVPDVALRGRTKRGVLFHNGTWGKWLTGFDVVKEIGAVNGDATPAGWSDSRVMAALAAKYDPRAVAEIVGDTQRLAVLRPDATIETFGSSTSTRGSTRRCPCGA